MIRKLIKQILLLSMLMLLHPLFLSSNPLIVYQGKIDTDKAVVTKICVDGYMFLLTVSNKNLTRAVSISSRLIQVFERGWSGSYAPQPKKCKKDKTN